MKNLIENLRDYLTSKFTTKQNNTVANVIMFAGFAISILDMMNNPLTWNWGPNIAAIVLVVIGAVYQALFVRCPYCGDSLKGEKNKLPTHCPKCHGDLNKLPK